MYRYITKTCLCNIEIFFFFNFYKMKISLEKFYTFYYFAENIDWGNMLELSHRGGFNEYPQSMFGSKIRGIPLEIPVCL